MARTILTGYAVAADARRYDGEGYVYGGDCSAGPGDWDCSSMPSYDLGHDLGLDLPGGRWGDPGMPPNAHGPVVVDWARWQGAVTVPYPQAGDLCIWVGEGPNGHMGIALSRTHMISALNEQAGTAITPILGTGPAGAPLIYRRVLGTVTPGAAKAQGIRQPSGAGALAVELLVAAGALAGLVVAGWAVVTFAPVAVAGGLWLWRKWSG